MLRSLLSSRWTRSALTCLTLVAALAVPAVAAIIPTAPLEDVVRHSSHVAFGTWDADDDTLAVSEWLRGESEQSVVRVHGMPAFAEEYVVSPQGMLQTARKNEGKAARTTKQVVLFLEEIDGRLYLTGYRRYGERFGAHSSLRIVTGDDVVLRLMQVINPGHPEPTPADIPGAAAFREHLRGLLRSVPYVPMPGDRPAVDPEQRDAFFAAIAGAFDWYQGMKHDDLIGWSRGGISTATIPATAKRLGAWIDAAPREQKVHGLDAMMILCRIVQGGGPDTSAVQAEVAKRLPEADPAMTRAWILRELRHGDYYVNRDAFGRLAKLHGEDTLAEAVDALEATLLRTRYNEGSASYLALIRLGEKKRAEAALATHADDE